jgi:hypothetical protein
MVSRGDRQDGWILGVHHALRAALGRELKTIYGLPTELTPKLSALVSRMDRPRTDAPQAPWRPFQK